MFSYIPSTFRCIGCISNLRSRGLFSAPVNFNNNYNPSKIPQRRPLVLFKISCSYAWRWGNSRRSDLRIALFQMDVPKHIIADPSGDIGRLSASLAELNNEARGLAKVNLNKLESVHSTGSGDHEGDSEHVQVAIGKSKEVSDVGSGFPGMNVGKGDGSTGERHESLGEFGEEAGETVESGSELTPPSNNFAEEAAALDEVLRKIISAPREQDGMEPDVQDLTDEQNLGKIEGTEERKTPQKKGLGDGAEVGDMVGKAESRREPGAKLKEDAAKAMARSRNVPVGGEVGKTEQAPGLGKYEEKNESSEGQAEIRRSTAGKIQEDVARAFNQNAQGKLQEDADKFAGQNAPTKLEENLRKLYQSLGSDSYTGIVGKTEGKEFVSTPGSFIDAKGAGKHPEEGNKLSVGQANIRSNSLGKVQEDVGKAVNQDVRGAGNVQEDVGKALGQTPNVKHQRDASGATVQSQKTNLGISDESVSASASKDAWNNAEELEAVKVEAGDKAPAGHQLKTFVEDSADKRRGVGKNEVDTLRTRGHGHVGIVIYLASKGLAEAKYVEKLKYGEGLQLPDGAQVIPAAEVTDGRWTEVFDVNRYLKNLFSCEFGRFVLYSPLVPSTHTLLSQNFHSFPTGAICVAGAQLQGRGRAGNVWQSPKGCLMVSFTIHMTNGRLVPFLQYVVSLAVIEAVEHICEAGKAPSPDLKIKWPNDLYAKGVKIGGVLCTSSYRAKTFNIVVGIGLNVGNREPTTCLDAIIQDLDPQAHAIQQEDLLAAIMYKFEGLNTIFQDQGFTPLQDAYYGKWMHGGQSVILEEKKSGTSNVLQVPVTIQGLTNMGFLLATDNEGEEYELHPDGNSFDFLKGLVRQKVSS